MRIVIPQDQIPPSPGIFRALLRAMAIRSTESELEIEEDKLQEVREQVALLLNQEQLACCRLCALHVAGLCSADGQATTEHARQGDCPRQYYHSQQERQQQQRQAMQHRPALERPPVTAAQVATFAQALVGGRYVPDPVRRAREAICRRCVFQRQDSKGIPWCSLCGCGTSNSQKQIRNLAAYEEKLPKWGCKHPHRSQGEGWPRDNAETAPPPTPDPALSRWQALPDWRKNRTPKPAAVPLAEPVVRQPAPLFLPDERPVYLPDLYRERSAFLICGGPSFGLLDPALLRQPGILTMAVNNAPKTFRPQLWVHVDAADHFLRSIYEDPTVLKFCPWSSRDQRIFDSTSWQWTNQRVQDCPNVLFYKRHTGFAAERFLQGESFCWGNDAKEGGARSVMLVAIRILYELGVRQVFLLGADFAMGPEAKYHFAQDRSPGSIRGNNYTYQVLQERFGQLRPHFEQAGFHVYNCNPHSQLRAFDYVPYAQAVAIARGALAKLDLATERTAGLYDQPKPALPKPEKPEALPTPAPPLRGMPYPLLQWAPLRYPERSCVMTGCDARHQWILPWWYANLRQTNPELPIVFVDKGMDDAGRSWCQERGLVVRVSWKDHIMFAKPLGIIQSPFAQTMWLDPDCEVRGPLAGAFATPRAELAAVYDTSKFMGPNHIQAGMVIVQYGSAEALRWASLCAWGFACRTLVADRKNVCDQAVLNYVADQNPACMTILPQSWNWVRGLGRNSEAVVYHWTGAAGKRRIAQQLQERSYDATPRNPLLPPVPDDKSSPISSDEGPAEVAI